NVNIGVGTPSTRPAGPVAGLVGGALAGGAAAEFLHNRPSNTLPGAGNIASTLPARPGGATNLGDGNRPGAGDRPSAGQPSSERPGVSRPGQPGDRPVDIGRPGRPGERPVGPGGREFVQSLPNRILDRNEWGQWRQQQGRDIKDFVQTHPGAIRNWFEENWWSTSGIYYPYYPGFDSWAWSQWPGVTGWVDSAWTDPIYYNYGENVYYQDGSVFYGDQAVASEDDYAKQAEAIATSAPETKPDAKDWLPLGVFAIAIDGEPA